MLNPNTVRILEPREQYVYHRAVYSNNKLTQTSILMDGQILAAQKNALRQTYAQIPDFTDEIATLTEYAQRTIAESDQADEGLWTDYYRLISQTLFLEQRLKAPLVLEKPRNWKEREQLVNGTYGMSAHMIREAIDEYDNMSPHADKELLRGAIQEQTFIALFNREQRRNRLAVPSATYDDLCNRIDADVWSLRDKQTEPFYLPVQVKSSRHHSEKHVSPKNGITIYAEEFDNNRNLSISRLIACEYDDMMGEGAPLSQRQLQKLETAHANLFAAMEYKSQHIF
jgi:hypothetical protein